jgi:chromosomal replication initiation ATPase DnaA
MSSPENFGRLRQTFEARCRAYHVAPADVLSRSRAKNFVRARRAVWGWLRSIGKSDNEIARLTGHNRVSIARGLKRGW